MKLIAPLLACVLLMGWSVKKLKHPAQRFRHLMTRFGNGPNLHGVCSG
jgi:hypothetical protein